MITIAQNNYYEIYFRPDINRIYYTVKGYWPSVDAVPDYLTHIAQVLELVRPNFTMLLDIRTMEAHPPEVEALRRKAQEMAVGKGMFVAAALISVNFLSQFQLDTMTDSTNFRRRKFQNVQDAEDWLDEQVRAISF